MLHCTPASSLGAAIRKRRTALKVSQEAFADLIGMHRAYCSAIERGERNLTLGTLTGLPRVSVCGWQILCGNVMSNVYPRSKLEIVMRWIAMGRFAVNFRCLTH
jgi:predicted transcriptional regulator